MTFKIIIQQMPISAEFEVGSLSEAVGILQEQESAIRGLGEIADDLNGTPEAPEATNAAGETAPPKRRGRPAKGADPATATAPAPLPIPGATPPPAPAAPVDTSTVNPNGLPAFLDRTAPAAPPAPAAAAPPPPPPPAPAAPPPSGILAGKVIANLDARKAGAADGGESLAAWLAQAGLVVAGSTYDEAINAIRLISDDKLATVAKTLEVA